MKEKAEARRSAPDPCCAYSPRGEKTEINYIRGYISDYLKSREYLAHDIIIEQPTDFSPRGLLDAAKRECGDCDIGWIVFDCDRHARKAETMAEAATAGIRVAYSSICFETWILMHFKYSTRAYASCKGIRKDLDVYFPGGYEKNIGNLFELSAGTDGERLARARENAGRLCLDALKATPGKARHELNPYTDFHLLLDAIDEFIREKALR